jgi:hypothetical protein
MKVALRLLAIAKTGRQKASSASTAGVDAGYASARAVNLYLLSSYEEEVTPLSVAESAHRNRLRLRLPSKVRSCRLIIF